MKTLTIGRLPDCNIVINDPSVSKMHAELIIENNTISVRDLGSTNGTYVNDIRINNIQPLIILDTLKVANSSITWEKYIPINSLNYTTPILPEIKENINPILKQSTNLNQTIQVDEDKITCPKCGSSQVHIDTKGVSGLKACCGGAICGPLGLLFGLSGSKKILRTCLKCNNTWYK